MKPIILLILMCFGFSARSQKIFVQETDYYLESILKKALIANKDSITEIPGNSDYIIKIVVETRGALEPGTVKSIVVKASSGSVIYETQPEKVTSENGIPTSAGLKNGVNHIAENKIKEISLAIENDYLKNRAAIKNN